MSAMSTQEPPLADVDAKIIQMSVAHLNLRYAFEGGITMDKKRITNLSDFTAALTEHGPVGQRTDKLETASSDEIAVSLFKTICARESQEKSDKRVEVGDAATSLETLKQLSEEDCTHLQEWFSEQLPKLLVPRKHAFLTKSIERLSECGNAFYEKCDSKEDVLQLVFRMLFTAYHNELFSLPFHLQVLNSIGGLHPMYP